MERGAATRANGSGARDRTHGGQAETQPADYALLNGVWIALVGGLVAASRGRTSEDPIELRELLPLSAATFALSKAVARERIGTWVREPFVDEEHDQKPRGGRLRKAVGELVTCTRCVGTWSALGVVGLRVLHPQAGRTVSTILATSAGNDWAQAAFKYLCEATNRVATDTTLE